MGGLDFLLGPDWASGGWIRRAWKRVQSEFGDGGLRNVGQSLMEMMDLQSELVGERYDMAREPRVR